MSGNADVNSLSEYGAIAVSILTLLTFAGCLVIAYVSRDQTSIALLVGAVVANASTAVSYWLGSSRGSQKKDEIMAAKGPVP